MESDSPRRRRKLLVASIGVASVSYAVLSACGKGPPVTGNLPAPPPSQTVPPVTGNLPAPPPLEDASVNPPPPAIPDAGSTPPPITGNLPAPPPQHRDAGLKHK